MRKRTAPLAFTVTIGVVALTFSFWPGKEIAISVAPAPTPAASASPSPTATHSGVLARVVKVTDGDTFRVELDGVTETVRLVGVNTPETKDPRKKVQCYGQEASDFLHTLLLGKVVGLTPDPTQSNRDRYGRLLRFAATEDGQDVGTLLLGQGYAQTAQYGSAPHTLSQRYQDAERDAQAQKRGLWSPEACPLKVSR